MDDISALFFFPVIGLGELVTGEEYFLLHACNELTCKISLLKSIRCLSNNTCVNVIEDQEDTKLSNIIFVFGYFEYDNSILFIKFDESRIRGP